MSMLLLGQYIEILYPIRIALAAIPCGDIYSACPTERANEKTTRKSSSFIVVGKRMDGQECAKEMSNGKE